MKLHWGHGIAIFYSFFVAVLVIVVIKSTQFDNSLVANDYYARDINYQVEYDRRANSAALLRGPDLTVNDHDCRLEFPPLLAASAQGTLTLYRPSSERHDRTVTIELDDRDGMNLSTENLPSGRYRAIVEWSAGGILYLDEFELTL